MHYRKRLSDPRFVYRVAWCRYAAASEGRGSTERGTMDKATMTGVEFKRFYQDPDVWGEGTFHDDAKILVNGLDASENDIDLSAVDDTAVVVVECGEIAEGLQGVPEDMVEAISWWRARQVSVQMNITVPRERVEELKAVLAGMGLEALAVA